MSHLTVLDRIFRAVDPHNSPSTIRTYVSCINSLCKKAGLEPTQEDFAKKYKTVIEHLSVMKDATQKAYFSACIKFLKPTDFSEAKEAYATMFSEMKKKVQKVIDSKEPTKQFKDLMESDFTWESVLQCQKILENEYLADLYNPNTVLSKAMLWRIQQLILLSCYTHIEPRRSQDYCDFVIKNPDKDKDNYMLEVEPERPSLGEKKFFFVFNSYKTSKVYGQQRVEVPKKLADMITRWSQITDTKFMFMLYKREAPLSPPNLCHVLYDIFDGRKVSVNLLRHLFLAQYAKQDEERRAIALRMGHNMSTQLNYIYKTSSD